MGKEPADILLASLPPQGWSDLATKTDLRAEIATLRADLTKKIATHTWIHVLATIGAVVSVSVMPRVLS
jgi:hypothetical protein